MRDSCHLYQTPTPRSEMLRKEQIMRGKAEAEGYMLIKLDADCMDDIEREFIARINEKQSRAIEQEIRWLTAQQ